MENHALPGKKKLQGECGRTNASLSSPYPKSPCHRKVREGQVWHLFPRKAKRTKQATTDGSAFLPSPGRSWRSWGQFSEGRPRRSGGWSTCPLRRGWGAGLWTSWCPFQPEWLWVCNSVVCHNYSNEFPRGRYLECLKVRLISVYRYFLNLASYWLRGEPTRLYYLLIPNASSSKDGAERNLVKYLNLLLCKP